MTNTEAAEILKVARAEVEWEYPIDIAAALDLAISAIERDRWISVEDRLPEQGERYLVIRFDEVTKTQFIDILWHDAHDLWWNRLYKGQYNVTHWMPLPEPPKEET